MNKNLYAEHGELVHKKYFGDFTPDDSARLLAVRIELDEIEERKFGPALKKLERRVTEYEKQCKAFYYSVLKLNNDRDRQA